MCDDSGWPYDQHERREHRQWHRARLPIEHRRFLRHCESGQADRGILRKIVPAINLIRQGLPAVLVMTKIGRCHRCHRHRHHIRTLYNICKYFIYSTL